MGDVIYLADGDWRLANRAVCFSITFQSCRKKYLVTFIPIKGDLVIAEQTVLVTWKGLISTLNVSLNFLMVISHHLVV